MLKRLRVQLTILYILAALGLVALISTGANLLLGYYFQRQTDLALSYKMALAFRQYNLSLTPELLQAEQDYLRSDAPQAPQPTQLQPAVAKASPPSEEEREDDDKKSSHPSATSQPEVEGDREEHYDEQLAPIYVLPVDAQGNLLASTTVANLPFSVNQEAKQAALLHGSDLRTVRSQAGASTRLLTYRVDHPDGPVFLQVGRGLADQERIRNQFLLGLIVLGAVATVLLGLGSWWLSGQSLIPAQKSWDQQMTFISNASHELRTPLTLIRASAEVIQRSPPLADEEQNLLIDDILTECDYMDRLVADLLLLSRLDTHRLQLLSEPVHLPDLLGEIAQQATKMTGAKAIAVEMGEVQGTVLADPGRLRQVLLILLDNAIRYTPDGGSIRLEAIPQHRTCQIRVSDTGPGIAPEHLPHIFDRFYQANPTGEGDTRSNGLGLSIAKGIIVALGGKISIHSQPGAGTQAVVELPLSTPNSSQKANPGS
jgi:signal transduction histidine kinase